MLLKILPVAVIGLVFAANFPVYALSMIAPVIVAGVSAALLSD